MNTDHIHKTTFIVAMVLRRPYFFYRTCSKMEFALNGVTLKNGIVLEIQGTYKVEIQQTRLDKVC